ncbi:MAG: phosphate ABC transporter permease subunit PstC [Coriobacteriaceae bacterium]|nr:phosphate ABC transporter permease subunit PstC [Olegusella massiliensis]MBS5865221.1 phosphate ABC transporter permease subunit PstC [Coriobacteriaceae bacterium]
MSVQPKVIQKDCANIVDIGSASSQERGACPTAAVGHRLAKRKLEWIGLGLTSFCVALVTLVMFALIIMVFSQGLMTFLHDGVDFGTFLTSAHWIIDRGYFGAASLIVGSFSVTLLSTLFTLPIAIGSAIFVVEIQPSFGRKVFQPLVELLVGIPSVVYGLLGLAVVNSSMRMLFGKLAGTGAGILSGAIVLAVMILPTVTTLTIDALAAVPLSYREGSYALGCTRWQTVRHVVLRSATPGIMTAVIMGMTRAFGETLAVQFVIGGVERAMPTSLFSPAATLTTALTSGFANATTGSVPYHALWSLGMLLLAMSLFFILLIHLIEKKGKVKHG